MYENSPNNTTVTSAQIFLDTNALFDPKYYCFFLSIRPPAYKTMVLDTGKIANLRPWSFILRLFLQLALTHSQLKDHDEESNMYVGIFTQQNYNKVIHRKFKSLYMIFQQFASPILLDLHAKDAHMPFRSTCIPIIIKYLVTIAYTIADLCVRSQQITLKFSILKFKLQK